MKSAFWRSLALALVVALVLPSFALAGGEVARSSMSGTNWMNTSADTWVLFHRSLEGDGWAEFASQGYNGFDNAEGFGRLIIPFRDYRIGIAVNDRAAGSTVGSYAFNGGPYIGSSNIGTWVQAQGPNAAGNNAFWTGQLLSVKGAAAAGTGAVSLGIGIFGDSDEDNEASTKEESSGFSLNGSWGNGAPGAQGTIEIAAEFTKHTDKSEAPGGTVELDGNHISANGRYSVSDDSHLEASFAKMDSDWDDGAATDTYGATAFKLAYVRDLIEDADRGAHVELAYDYLKYTDEQDGAEEITDTDTTFPSWRFSFWHQIRGNWKLYGGISSTYDFKNSDENPNVPSDTESKGNDSFDWTAGLGWDPTDNLGIELFLMTDNLDQTLSLGNDSPLIGGIGAHGAF